MWWFDALYPTSAVIGEDIELPLVLNPYLNNTLSPLQLLVYLPTQNKEPGTETVSDLVSHHTGNLQLP